ncbi:MAG: vapC3 [Ilumatobacteraceae bacterium]|nr:vapC3 [Ilumatobacteraceae bacterium]
MVDVVVIDASAVVDALVNGRRSLGGLALAAPAHLDAEVLSALGRLCRHGLLSSGDVGEMLDDLAALPLHRLELPALLGHAFALRDNVSLRDALYVTAAQVLGVPLFTVDGRLARACQNLSLCGVHPRQK